MKMIPVVSILPIPCLLKFAPLKIARIKVKDELLTAETDTGEEINFHLTDAPTEKSNEEEKAEVLEKDVEVVKDAKTPDSQAIQLRIPYNNGYGDFCFGRWANRPQKSLWTGGPLDQACWERESCGAIVPELDGFQR